MIPTRWPSYTLLIFAAFLGWAIPFGLPLFWRIIGVSPRKSSTEVSAGADDEAESSPVSARFHLAALLFLGFFAMVVLCVPLLFAVRSEQGDLSSILIVGIMIPLAIVLFYCLRKGDLSWNVPRSREESPERGGDA